MKNIKLFENKRIRSSWDAEQEKWYFSAVTNCNALKMEAPDGKLRLTDAVDTEQLFRLIQSIPSPKAEPFVQMKEK